jgi:hypothetical protein
MMERPGKICGGLFHHVENATRASRYLLLCLTVGIADLEDEEIKVMYL